jgi:Tfp pilus assembly protein PilV
MRLLSVGVVGLALLASTAVASAQSSTSQKQTRHHATYHAARHVTRPTAATANENQAPADFQGNVGEPAGPHYGRAAGGTSYNRSYPSESEDVSKMLDWKSSR